MINIKEIAKLANVAPSTVSKALNNRTDISAETRTRIIRIAQEKNYAPSAPVRNLKTPASENIGIIFSREQNPLSDNPFYSRILEGIEAELAINGYNLVLNLIQNGTAFEFPKMIQKRQVDGVILIGNFDDSFAVKIKSLRLPAVFIDPQHPIKDYAQVLIDNEHGAFNATQYLIRNGHRRIGFISGDLKRLSFKQRFEGYKKALHYHKIPIDNDLIQTGGLENGYMHVKRLLMLQNHPTAIFAGNDINAIHGYKAIQDHNLKIPDDLSMVGFDDIYVAKYASPSLTTIRVYTQELGSMGVRTLFKLIHQEIDAPITAVIPTRLVERDSVKKLE